MNNRVKMLKSLPGVHDGELHPVAFIEGEEYHIGPDLLQAFVNCGAVELVDEADEEKSGGSGEEKSEGDSPSNKMKKAAPVNKAK